MSDLDQQAIEKALRQFFWDGKLSTSMFNVYDEAGRPLRLLLENRGGLSHSGAGRDP